MKNLADSPTSSSIQMTTNNIIGFCFCLIGFITDFIPIVGLVLSIIGVIVCRRGRKQTITNQQSSADYILQTSGRILGMIGIITGSLIMLSTLIGVIIGTKTGLFSINDYLLMFNLFTF